MKFPVSYHVCVSDDGGRVAFSGSRVTLVSTKSARKIAHYSPFRNISVTSLNSDGGRLAISDTQGRVCVVDCPSRKILWIDRNMRGRGSIVYSVCDQWLVEATYNGVSVRVSETGEIKYEQELGRVIVSDVKRSRKGDVYAFTNHPIGESGRNWLDLPYITYWEWPLRSPSSKIYTGLQMITAFDLAPSGVQFVAGGWESKEVGNSVVVMTIDGKTVGKVKLGGDKIKAIAWHPNGKWFYCALEPRSKLRGLEGLAVLLGGATNSKRIVPPAPPQHPYMKEVDCIGGAIMKVSASDMAIEDVCQFDDPWDMAIDVSGSFMCVASGSKNSSMIYPLK